MATSSPSITYDNSTDALFRAWVAAFDTAMLAIGLLHTADTGQIDTSTVLKPSAGSQSRGYIMYKPNDGLTDYYVRIDFGSGLAGALQPTIYATVGWTTDGAGNLTGTQVTGQVMLRLVNTNAAAGALTSNFCKSGSAWAFSTNETLSGGSPASMVMAVDRSRNAATGAATTSGVSILWACANVCTVSYTGTTDTAFLEYLPASGGRFGPAFSNRIPYAAPNHTGTWSRGSNVGVAPVVPWDGGGVPVPVAALVISPTDASVGTTFSASLYGTARTYRHCNGLTDDQSNLNQGRVCHIWE
jgi:hypothetical protein